MPKVIGYLLLLLCLSVTIADGQEKPFPGQVEIIFEKKPRSQYSTIYDTPHEAVEKCPDGIVRAYKVKNGEADGWICDAVGPATAAAREIFGDDIGKSLLEQSRRDFQASKKRYDKSLEQGHSAKETSQLPGSRQNATIPSPPSDSDSTTFDDGTCTVDRDMDTTSLCIGTNERCRCIVVSNTCPYPVTVQWFLTNSSRSKPSRNSVDAKKTEKFCGTRDGTQEPLYLGWYPWRGYPKQGQPNPSYR